MTEQEETEKMEEGYCRVKKAHTSGDNVTLKHPKIMCLLAIVRAAYFPKEVKSGTREPKFPGVITKVIRLRLCQHSMVSWRCCVCS